MFSGISFEKFNRHFKTNQDCLIYLYDLKWSEGFNCRKCGHHLWYKGHTHFHRRCQLCSYDESATANTLFHKIKFPLIKAFGIAFIITARKKGMSTMELSRAFAIRQMTAWLFKRKLQEAMSISTLETIPKTSSASSKDIKIGGAEKEFRSKFLGSEKTARITVFKVGKTIVGGKGELIEDEPQLSEDCILMPGPEAEKNYEPPEKENQFNNAKPIITSGVDIVIFNLRNWLQGIHHHCSGHFVYGYLNEFFFRFNRRKRLKKIWHQLICRMVSATPYFYRPSRSK